MKQTQWAPGALLMVMLSASCPLAHAQWLWLNDKGVKQLSDQPPPASVPPSRILKAPRGQMPDLRKELNEQPAAPAAQSPAPAAGPSLAERNAEFNKRKQEAAVQANNAATAAQAKAAQAENCELARSTQRALDGGMRIARVDGNGERYFLNDAERAERQRSVTESLSHCK